VFGASSHSRERSPLRKISSHIASIPIGAPHIKIDLASPAEVGFAEAAMARAPFGQRVLQSRTRARNGDALQARSQSYVSWRVSLHLLAFCWLRTSTSQPMCPGSGSRHLACDPGCAARTASATGKDTSAMSGLNGRRKKIKKARRGEPHQLAPRYLIHLGFAIRKKPITCLEARKRAGLSGHNHTSLSGLRLDHLHTK